MTDPGDPQANRPGQDQTRAERHHAQESPEYRLLALGLFPLLLAAAILVRIVTLGRGRLVARDRPRQSVFAEARAAADTILPWAFSKG
ncbi:hypothetical protein [Rhodovibrio salinarum]|uniref:Uncharacterized protein n=1 Tax=Rhodovibrio salinarum TaxID=1087 RepID=A0A934QKJ9_9PROT|nr:hypothetical protein [Rhodovibrio salinarum]MBK1698858.1 hypothetical protein [Rhodovibrio salinarum]